MKSDHWIRFVFCYDKRSPRLWRNGRGTYGTGTRVTNETAITAAVKARARTWVHAEVAVATGLEEEEVRWEWMMGRGRGKKGVKERRRE